MNKKLTKICCRCHIEKSTDDFHRTGYGYIRSQCKVCTLLYVKGYMARPDQKLRRQNYRLKSLFGITLDQYTMMAVKQNYRCLICKRHRDELNRALDVDHDHKTGKIRGLLCKTCNVGLGNFFDDVDRLLAAIKYLQTQGERKWENVVLAQN